MTGVAYATSAEMADELGAFPGYARNRDHMLRVIRNHRRAAHGQSSGYEDLSVPPVPINDAECPDPALPRGRSPGLGPGAGAGRAATASATPSRR